MNSMQGRAMVILLVVCGIMATGVVAASTVSVDSGVEYETASELDLTVQETHNIGYTNPFTRTSVTVDDVTVVGHSRRVNMKDVSDARVELQQQETSTFNTGRDIYGGLEVDIDGDSIDEVIYLDSNFEWVSYDFENGGQKSTLSINDGNSVLGFVGANRDRDNAEEIIWEDGNNYLHEFDVEDGTDTNLSIKSTNYDKADTDGDGVDEILTRDDSGELVIHDTDGGTTTLQLTAGVSFDGADIDDDGADEIAVVNANGDLELWDRSDGVKSTSFAATSVLRGNVDKDEEEEILIEHSSEIKVYQPNSETVENTPVSGSLRIVVDVGDTDGDSVEEIVSADLDIERYDHVDNQTDYEAFKSEQLFGVGDFDDDGAAEIGFDESNDEFQIHDPTPTTRFERSGKKTIHYGGEIDVGAVPNQNIALDDGTADIYYGGVWANTAERIIVHGFSPGQSIVAVDGGGNIEHSDTVDSAGRLEIKVTDDAGGENLKLREVSPPTVDNSNADPKDKELITQKFQADLSVPIDDPDFDDSSDSLTVEWYVNGKLKSTESYSSAGLASETVTLNEVGEQTWHIKVEDKYGLTTRSNTFEFATRADLNIKNVSNTSELVDGVNTTVEFFGNERVITRTSQTGSFSFDGLPTDEKFEARASAPGYHSRTVIIDSFKSQQSIYLLDKNVAAVKPRFVIDSAVASFPETESTILIERPVKINGSTRYVRITGESPGVKGLDITLKKNQRYRITVRSPSGETRQIGKYLPTATEQVTLQIESQGFDATQEVNGIGLDASYVSSTPAILASIAGPDVSQSRVVVSYRSNGTEVFNQTEPGNVSLSVPVSNGTVYVVNMTAEANGETVVRTQQLSSGRVPAAGTIDNQYLQLFGMVGLLIVAGLFTRANAGIGAIATASVGGIFWWVGWFDGVATGLSVVVALLIGVFAYAKQKRGGVPT